MDRKEIFQCRGRHFKVYWADKLKVLEHPSDTEEVSLTFYLDDLEGVPHLEINVTDYIQTKMRISGQKMRADLYILPSKLKGLGKILKDASLDLECPQWRFSQRFGKPFARGGRQGVPEIQKIGDFNVRRVSAPFGTETLILQNGFGVLDLEKPGEDQTKWEREGGSLQFHFGFFMFKSSDVNQEKGVAVKIHIPANYLVELGETFDNFSDA